MPVHPLRDDRLTLSHVFLATAMGTLGVLATLPAWNDILHIAYTDEENSHIFIVPLVALALIWVRRMRLRHCRPTGRIVGPLLVGIGWAVGSYGFYRGIQSFWHGGAVMVVVGCMLSILGKNVVFRFFPLIVLIFLVPAPARVRLAIASPLQNWTTAIAEKLLEVCGVVDAEITGNVLRIKGQPVLVAEACNGLRMVFALILVSFAFGFAMPLRNFVRILILLLSPLAAIFCNVIRMLPTVWMYGNATRPHADQFHNYAGWAMLPLAFLMLYGIIKLLQWAMIPVNRYTLASQ